MKISVTPAIRLLKASFLAVRHVYVEYMRLGIFSGWNVTRMEFIIARYRILFRSCKRFHPLLYKLRSPF